MLRELRIQNYAVIEELSLRLERVRDIARMLGGDPERDASLEHARRLLGQAAGASRAATG